MMCCWWSDAEGVAEGVVEGVGESEMDILGEMEVEADSGIALSLGETDGERDGLAEADVDWAGAGFS